MDNDMSENGQEEQPPEFLPSRPGRVVSARGLVERVVEQFYAEYGEDEDEVVRAMEDRVERRSVIRDIAEYIFGIESVQIDLPQRARIIARAHSEIFGYGPLDALFSDERVTTITLEGTEKAAVRYSPGTELQPLNPIFEEMPQMQGIIKRLLRDAGAELRPDAPIIEAGLMIEGRRVCVNLAAPPYVPQLAADIRVHPVEMPTLDELAASGYMDAKGETLLRAIAQSPHGFVIVGDTESGKTTLLSVLAQFMPENTTAVERAGELSLPEKMKRLRVRWPVGDDPGITFAEQVETALQASPACLLLDEVRSDEPEAVAPLLQRDDVPRLVWSFRGSSYPNRIRSALGMLARMADPTLPEAMVYALYDRLPFVIVMRRRGGLQLREIAEWQFPEQSGDEFVYADYVPLLTYEDNVYKFSGKHPRRELNLPADFWE